MRADELVRHRPLAILGPDLLGDFNPDVALARIRLAGDTPMHDVLLNQRVMSGVGNVYKSEILFLRASIPTRPPARSVTSSFATSWSWRRRF